MKCLKCGVDAPPNLKSSLCPACFEAQQTKNSMGCLYAFLGLMAVVVLVILAGELLKWLDPSFGHLVLLCFVLILTIAIWMAYRESKLSPSDKNAMIHGYLNSQIVCAHCQTKGSVRTKLMKKDVGISGKKATAAALTGGISLLATGLSRKEKVTQAHCDNCGSTWTY